MSKGDKVYIVYLFSHNRFVERKLLKIYASIEDAKDWVDSHYMEYMTEDEDFVDIDIIPADVN